MSDYLRANGWPHAKPVGAGSPGADVTGTPGLAFEVKARAGFEPAEWLRQAAGRVGLPVVVLRLNGQGIADPAVYFAGLRLGDLVTVLGAAGYGDGGAR